MQTAGSYSMVFQLDSLHPLVLQLKQLIVLKKKLNAVCVCVSVMGLRARRDGRESVGENVCYIWKFK